jgi:hypothetical protein
MRNNLVTQFIQSYKNLGFPLFVFRREVNIMDITVNHSRKSKRISRILPLIFPGRQIEYGWMFSLTNEEFSGSCIFSGSESHIKGVLSPGIFPVSIWKRKKERGSSIELSFSPYAASVFFYNSFRGAEPDASPFKVR